MSGSLDITLIPVSPDLEKMKPYLSEPFFELAFNRMTDYYKIIGYELPWVGYFALNESELIGVGGIKGKPRNNRVEISYGTYPGLESKGISTAICCELVHIAREASSKVEVMARTLEKRNASTRILQKNKFELVGKVNDAKYGLVWEWQYSG